VGALRNPFLLNFLLWGGHFLLLNLPLGWLLSDGLPEGDIETRYGLSNRLPNALGRDLVSVVKPEVFGRGGPRQLTSRLAFPGHADGFLQGLRVGREYLEALASARDGDAE
jgi:hypothetical protein